MLLIIIELYTTVNPFDTVVHIRMVSIPELFEQVKVHSGLFDEHMNRLNISKRANKFYALSYVCGLETNIDGKLLCFVGASEEPSEKKDNEQCIERYENTLRTSLEELRLSSSSRG